MNKEAFQKLFEAALEQAALNAENYLGQFLSRNFAIKLCGVGHSGSIMNVADATTLLYIDENLFHRVIDIAVIEIGKKRTVVFTRVSAYPPSDFEKTWNNPPGSGPFKQMIAQNIVNRDE